ncbi:hypothetical protein CBC_A0814 [Clostridium botulinum C str. Eklund]|nr:hypothetical protein CBC_A0814 [Clostridium botulinum C str. Eklund]
MKKQKIKVKIINKSGRNLNKELTQYIAKLYMEGRIKL